MYLQLLILYSGTQPPPTGVEKLVRTGQKVSWAMRHWPVQSALPAFLCLGSSAFAFCRRYCYCGPPGRTDAYCQEVIVITLGFNSTVCRLASMCSRLLLSGRGGGREARSTSGGGGGVAAAAVGSLLLHPPSAAGMKSTYISKMQPAYLRAFPPLFA